MNNISSDKTTRRHLVIACGGCGEGGSVASVALHHSRELSRYMQVTLISDSFPSQSIDGVDFVTVHPLRFYFLRRFGHVPNEYAFVKAVRRSLLALHQKQPVDVVICHSHALASLAAYPFRQQHGVPYALITHGDIFDRPPNTYDFRVTLFYKLVTRPAYRNADLILALSPYMADCAQRGGAAPERIKVVPNGIDPMEVGVDLSVSRLAGLEEKKTHVLAMLYVGRLAVEKGVEILIRACKRLQEKNVPFTLNIIGDGPLRASLKALVMQLDVSEKVKFIGKIPRAELGAYYSSADVFCIPSLSEMFGIAVLEALIAECPIVASDTGGLQFIVNHEQNGLVTPVGDVEAMANALERLYRHPELLKSLTRNARPSVTERFSWHTVALHIAEYVMALCNANRDQTI